MNTLYVSDLDGTLLSPQGVLSDVSHKMLEELLAEGLPFTVASARSVSSIRTLLRGLALRLPVVEFNGAYVSDLASGRHEIINAIDTPLVETLCAIVHECHCAPFVSCFNGTHDRLYYSQILNDGMQWYLEDRMQASDTRLRHLSDLRACFEEQVVCITVIGAEECVREVQRLVRHACAQKVEVTCYENRFDRGWEWLSIHDCRATKDQGIRSLLACCGIQECELVVFGDDVNDISMFRLADRAIAVEGAVESLKSLATHTIGPSSADSVAHFLRQEWNARKQPPPAVTAEEV